MRMARRVTARAVFDEHALDTLAGDVRQLVLIGTHFKNFCEQILRCYRPHQGKRLTRRWRAKLKYHDDGDQNGPAYHGTEYDQADEHADGFFVVHS